MKNIYFSLISLIIVGLSGFISCSNDDNYSGDENGTKISYEDLPVKSQNLITDYFDGYEVKSAYKTDVSYDVNLNKITGAKAVGIGTGYEIKFDINGDWIEIEAHSDAALPDNVLTLMNNHRTILLYIEREYSGRGVNEINKQSISTYKLELTGNPEIKLIFSSVTGEYIGLDSGKDNSQIITMDKLPADAKVFLDTHFAGLTPAKIEKDNDSYDVEFTNGTDVEFYLSGEWKEIEVENKVDIPSSIIGLLPAATRSYLDANHYGKRIEKIENKISCYELELAGLKDELIFDKQGELISNQGNGNSGNDERIIYENLPASIKEFLTKHFPDKFAIGKKDKDEYDIILKDGTEIEFDLNGNLKSVEVIPNKGYSVPESVMPEKINNYVKTNYPNKLVEEFEIKTNGYYKYKVEISGRPETELLFDADGNFLRTD